MRTHITKFQFLKTTRLCKLIEYNGFEFCAALYDEGNKAIKKINATSGAKKAQISLSTALLWSLAPCLRLYTHYTQCFIFTVYRRHESK